jgi:hypothetical protein
MTKKITLAFCVFCFFTIHASAQLYGGFFGGINSAKLNGDVATNVSYKSNMGLNAGLNFNIPLSNSIVLSLQPSFLQEGTRLFYSLPNKLEPVDSIAFDIIYFSLPVMLKIATANSRFYAITGIETAWQLNSSQTIDGVKQNLDVTLKTMNVSMHFGAGYWVPLGTPRLFIEARYAQGLINLTDDPLQDNVIPRVKTSGIRVLVGVEFPLGKN